MRLIAKLPVYEIDIYSNHIEKLEPGSIELNIETFDYDSNENKYIEVLVENEFEEDYIHYGELIDGETYLEGATKTIIVNVYERDIKVRKACINTYGVICSVCGINFEAVYGERGKDFIEIHHLIPLHKIKESYVVSADDLRPICSNCHSMIHRYRDNMTIERLRELIINKN